MKKLFVIFATIALVAAFAVSASAADWSLYGNARMATYWTSDDLGDKTFENDADDGDQDDLQWDLQSNSRIGATVKGDNLTARFEYGTGINLRRLYGVYDFGDWALKVGQDYTPVSQFISGQVFSGDLGLLGTGTFYGFRRPQISATFGNFEIALVQPTSTDLLEAEKVVANDLAEDTFEAANTGHTFDRPDDTTGGVINETLPLIEVKWGIKRDMWDFNIRGGWQSYEIQRGTGLSDEDVDSTVIAADGSVNFGAIKVSAAFSQGTNIGIPWFNWSESDPGAPSFGNGVPIVLGGSVKDVDTLQYALVVNFKASDTLTLEAGLGFKEDDIDVSTNTDGDPIQEDDQMAFYVQAVIQVAPGVFIIPEAGVFDYGDTFDNVADGGDSGDRTYFGAKWQINF